MIAAVALTCASFAAILLAMPGHFAWLAQDASRNQTPERVDLVALPREKPVSLPRVEMPSRARAIGARLVRGTTNAMKLDSTTSNTAPPDDPAPRSRATSPSPSGRLMPSGTPGAPWYTIPEGRAPFAPPPEATPAQRDSMLRAAADAFAELAARRVPTQDERDAAAKEAMLKIRNSGRALMVPPDNTGGLIASRISLPFLSKGPSRAARARETKAFDENRARLERLRERADSLRRARADSLARFAGPTVAPDHAALP